MKKALITGITGQVGSYLAEKYIKEGYEVHGMVRRTSSYVRQRIDHLTMDPTVKDKKLFLHYGDMTDGSNISRLMEKIMPDLIINMAAQSHVAISFQVPEYSVQVDGVGVLRILDAMKEVCPKAKLIHASTSEMFGKVLETPQKETTPFNPQSPYAVAKVYGYWIVRNYRDAYNLHASNIIMFNNESKRRSENFVTRKISMAVANIKKGNQEKVSLGNLAALRDWSHTKDMIDGIYKMSQQKKPDDFVFASGEQHSVEEFCKVAFARAGYLLKFKGKGINRKGYDRNGVVRVDVNPKYFRPTEVETLLGDASKAKKILKWEPKIKFKELVNMMVDHDIRLLK